MQNISILRDFSRTYTQYLGLLNKTILDSPLSLTESRIIYELNYDDYVTASKLRDKLRIDKGYLSRILKKLMRNSLVTCNPDLADQRVKVLSLTQQGKELFSEIDNRSTAQIGQLLSQLNSFETSNLISSLGQANRILSQGTSQVSVEDILIRNDLMAGDIGFVIHSHGELYKREYNYSILFEQYVAEGMLEYLSLPRPNKNRVWICEHNGYRMGFLLLLDRGDDIAQLRYFFVYPEYRGIGLGDKLMRLFIEYFRQSSFHQCYLWTTHELSAAAKLYKKYGFKLEEEKPSQEFGKELVEQKYTLDYANK